MTKDEALDLALEALEALHKHGDIACVVTPEREFRLPQVITAIKQARALDKKAENARELGLDYEPVGMVINEKVYSGFGEQRPVKTVQWRSDPPPAGTSVYTSPPAQRTALPDAITDDSESPEYRTGWNECREAMKGMMK